MSQLVFGAYRSIFSQYLPSVSSGQPGKEQGLLGFLGMRHLLPGIEKALAESLRKGLSIAYHNTIIFGFLLDFIS
jgi:hypothetical protein